MNAISSDGLSNCAWHWRRKGKKGERDGGEKREKESLTSVPFPYFFLLSLYPAKSTKVFPTPVPFSSFPSLAPSDFSCPVFLFCSILQEEWGGGLVLEKGKEKEKQQRCVKWVVEWRRGEEGESHTSPLGAFFIQIASVR